MPRWTDDAPASLDFDDVTALQVRLIAGTVAVMATDERPSVVVSGISGRPLQVGYDSGTLTIAYETLSWEQLLDWLKPLHDSSPGSHSVSGNVGGGSGIVSVNSVSGDVTLLRRAPHRTAARTETSRADAGMESETR
jgi:hypothetical protein